MNARHLTGAGTMFLDAFDACVILLGEQLNNMESTTCSPLVHVDQNPRWPSQKFCVFPSLTQQFFPPKHPWASLGPFCSFSCGSLWHVRLCKDILSFICILLFVGLKATYVFFSWLNYFLLASELDTLAMCGLVFVIGFLMFMLPIVPGTAVYLFSGVVAWFGGQLEWLTTCGRSEILIGSGFYCGWMWLINWSLTTFNHYNGPRALWLEIPHDPRCDEQATMSSEGNPQDAHSSSSLSKGLDHPSGLLFSWFMGAFSRRVDIIYLYVFQILIHFGGIYMANIFLIDSFSLRFWDSSQLPEIKSWFRASFWGPFSPPCWSTWLAPGSLASRESSRVHLFKWSQCPDPGLSAFLLQISPDVMSWYELWILADRYWYSWNVMFNDFYTWMKWTVYRHGWAISNLDLS